MGLLTLRELSGLGDVVPDWHQFLKNAGCSYSSTTDADGVFTEVITPPEGKTIAQCISEAQAEAADSIADPPQAPPAPPALVLCSPPCETLQRKVTQAKCDEWAEAAKTVRCASTVADDWATRPCSRRVPPDCYGRTKVRNRVLRDCYDWLCPQPGYSYDSYGRVTYSPAQYAPTPAYPDQYQAVQAEAAAAAAAELAALRAQRRALLAAARAAAQEEAVRAAAQEARAARPPTIAVPAPTPTPTQSLPPLSIPRRTPPLSIPRRRAPTFDTSKLMWLMAGAVAVMALRR